MARTVINPKTSQAGSSSAGDAHMTESAPDGTNHNAFANTGRELLLVDNDTGSAVTLTVHSAPDASQRLGDITAYNVPAGEKHIFGPFPEVGWAQSDGTVWFDLSGGHCAVIRVPSTP